MNTVTRGLLILGFSFLTEPVFSGLTDGSAVIGQEIDETTAPTFDGSTLASRSIRLNGSEVATAFPYTPPAATFGSYSVAYTDNLGQTKTVSLGSVVFVDTGAILFGSLTEVGAGAVAVTGAADGDYGDFTVAGGEISPRVTPLTVGDTTVGSETITVEAGYASVVLDETEINTTLAATPLSGGALKTRDGDVSASAQFTITPRAFTGEVVIEPHVWTTTSRNSKIPGMVLTDCQNLTVRGFDAYYERANSSEVEGFSGVFKADAPTLNIKVTQNEIHSRDTQEIVDADDFRDNFNTSLQARGVMFGNGDATDHHVGLLVDDNTIHDVSRNFIRDATNFSFSRNSVELYYSNPLTVGGDSDGGTIQSNNWSGANAAQKDTLGAIPSTSPHSSIGPSFDSSDYGSPRNILVNDNVSLMGQLRSEMELAASNPAIVLQATGCKFNDPDNDLSYASITIRNNLWVTHDITFEMSGGNGLVFENNTLAFETYTGATGTPSVYFQGANELRMRDNIAGVYTLGSGDGSSAQGVTFSRTLDTAQSYGNVSVMNTAGAFATEQVYRGDPVKGFLGLTALEAREAYKPVVGSYLDTAQKGFSYVNGTTFALPAATSGTAYNAPKTIWDGTAHGLRIGNLGLSANKELTFAIELNFDVSGDGVNNYLFSNSSNRMSCYRDVNGDIRTILKDASNVVIFDAKTVGEDYQSARGLHRFTMAIDLQNGRALHSLDGVPSGLPLAISVIDRVDIPWDVPNAWRLLANGTGANQFQGEFGQLMLTDTFIDTDTVAGLNELYAADGSFVEFDETVYPIVYRGTAASISNEGTGGAFTLEGSITDVGAAPTLIASIVETGETTADLTLEQSADGDAAYIIKTVNVAPDQTEMDASGTTVTLTADTELVTGITGLTADTTYYTFVQADDGTTKGAITGLAAITTDVAAATFTTADDATNGPTYFQDTANLGSGVGRLRWEAKGVNLPSTPATGQRFFAQVSTGCDLYPSSGDWYIVVEDSATAKRYNSNTGVALPASGTPFDLTFDVDLVAGTASVLVDASHITGSPFTLSAGTAEFQSGRKLGFFNNGGGGNVMQAGTEVESLAVYKDEVLLKEVTGPAATANADAWKLGSDAT